MERIRGPYNKLINWVSERRLVYIEKPKKTGDDSTVDDVPVLRRNGYK